MHRAPSPRPPPHPWPPPESRGASYPWAPAIPSPVWPDRRIYTLGLVPWTKLLLRCGERFAAAINPIFSLGGPSPCGCQVLAHRVGEPARVTLVVAVRCLYRKRAGLPTAAGMLWNQE